MAHDTQTNEQRHTLSLSERVLYSLVVLTVVTSLASAISNPKGWDSEWLSSWLQNFSIEMSGAFATFILLELVIVTQQRQRDTIRLDTLREAVTETIARETRHIQQTDAITRLRQTSTLAVRQSILDDLRTLDLLQGAHLEGAKLQGADLSLANLSGSLMQYGKLQQAHLGNAKLIDTHLQFANLAGARMHFASLDHANLMYTTLSGANLTYARLMGADLSKANLSYTKLMNAKLAGANLSTTNLMRARLAGATLDENTTLPDGTKWTPGTDMTRFTNPKHPDFWRPEPGSVWWYPKTDR